MVACSDNSSGGSSGGGSGGFRLYQRNKGYGGNSEVEFNDTQGGSNIATKDWAITIDGASVEVAGGGTTSLNGVHKKRVGFNAVPPLVVGQKYAITVTYSGNVSSLKAIFPFSGTLTCEPPRSD